MQAPELEAKLGIEVYATKTEGIGGRLRLLPEDFIVEEILIDGSFAGVHDVPEPVFAEKGRFLVCLLVKKNWDTFLAVRWLARRLKISEKRVNYAGIKDARALTAQHISIRNPATLNLQGISRGDLKVYPLRLTNRPITARALLRNRFRIVVRNVDSSFEQIRHVVETVRRELCLLGGVPNFYGHQRFGTVRPVSHIIGKYLLKGDFEKAVLTFLTEPSPYEPLETSIARKNLLETGDFKAAKTAFPRYLVYERLMLSKLSNEPRNFIGAFRRLPIRLQKLLVQAYQGYLFNRILSRRIKLGLALNRVEIGDFALRLDAQGLPTYSVKVTSQNQEEINKQVALGKMCLGIPIIGYNNVLSDGMQGEIERQILTEERVSSGDFYNKSMPEISAPSELRVALVPLEGFVPITVSEDELNAGRYKVCFSFELLRGAYATIVMREFMKSKDPVKAGY
jgi:tRNA pseudouridine13 synthase